MFYLRKLQNLDAIQNASAESIAKLLCKAKHIEKAFDKIGGNVSESTMIYAIVSKLDLETSRAWNRFRNVLAESWVQSNQKKVWEHSPTLEMLYKFLEDEKYIYANEMVAAEHTR